MPGDDPPSPWMPGNTFTTSSGGTAVEVTSVGAVSTALWMSGVDRVTLVFKVWDIVAGTMAKLTDVERWENAFLEWGETNAVYTSSGGKGFVVERIARRSTAVELLAMIVGSLWLVGVTMSVMIAYGPWSKGALIQLLHRPLLLLLLPYSPTPTTSTSTTTTSTTTTSTTTTSTTTTSTTTTTTTSRV